MVPKSKERPQKRKNLVPPKQVKQLKLDIFPYEWQTAPPRKNRHIVINRIDSVTKCDEMALIVEFKLIPSKIEFSKVKSTLWFDDQEVKSELIRIPQGFGISDEFQLKSELDMRGISAGAHTIKVELHDLYSSCFGIKEKTVEYVPLDRKSGYRKIPIAKKIAGDVVIVSNSDKEIYLEIDKTRKSELDSKRDKW
jgi:hypothetical protein